MEVSPLVSVSIITYNQRTLIGRALDSVLAQKVDFDYEIIVGDDCSDDGTQEVLRKYQRDHPGKIVLILHPRRYENEVPGRTNNATNLMACRGKYTATLDGDDFWTDEYKLGRQVAILEGRPDVSVTAHDLEIYDPEIGESERTTIAQAGEMRPSGQYPFREFVLPTRPFQIRISSYLFRTQALSPLPDWFYSVAAADKAILWILLSKGDLYWEERVSGKYFVNSEGMMSRYFKTPKFVHHRSRDYDIFSRQFPALRATGYSRRRRAMYQRVLFGHYFRSGNYLRSISSLSKVVLNDPGYLWAEIVRRVTS